MIDVAAASRYARPVRVFGTPGDHVDNAIHGVRPPDGPARATNHLNAVDVVHRNHLHVPINPRIKLRIYRPSIDEHENILGKLTAESANRHGPVVGINARHLDSRSKTEKL